MINSGDKTAAENVINHLHQSFLFLAHTLTGGENVLTASESKAAVQPILLSYTAACIKASLSGVSKPGFYLALHFTAAPAALHASSYALTV